MRVLILLFVSMWATGAFAQSLGDVARREAERRKTVKATGKVYTNDELKGEPLPSASPAAPGPQAGAGAPAAPAAPPAAGSGTKPGAGAPPAAAPPAGAPPAGSAPQAANDEQGWRARVQASREALSRAQLFADALQSRINGLSADFTARDDPAQRSAVAADRQKSLDELERVRKEIQAHTKALADIQEEGRRAGVPAGWLR
jgi:hypothetical protein